MNLFIFEAKKVLFSKKFLFVLGLLIVSIILLFFRNMSFQSHVEKEERLAIDNQVKTSQSNGRIHQRALEGYPDDEKQQLLQEINLQIRDQLYSLSSTFSAIDWQRNVAMQNDILAKTLTYKKEGGESPLSKKEILQTIAMNEELLERGIRPENETYSLAVPNFMKQVVDVWLHGGALIFLVLLIGETMSSEFENHSIKLLFTQPLKKSALISSKFWSSVVVYVLALLVLLITAIGISALFGDKGSLSYPILIEQNQSMVFIGILEYMIKGLIITTSLVFLVIVLTLLYSLYLKKRMSTLAALLGTFAIGYGLTLTIQWSPFTWLNPFAYLMPSELVQSQNNRFWHQAIPITLLLTVIVYGWSTWKVKKSQSIG